MTPDIEIQRADPRARRRALALGVGAAVAGGALIAALPGWLEGWTETLLTRPATERARIARLLVWAAAGSIGVPVLVLGAYFWRAGGRVLRAGRWPAPGARVISDTPVLRGGDALRHGRRLRRLGYACLAGGPALAAYSYWRLASLPALLGAG